MSDPSGKTQRERLIAELTHRTGNRNATGSSPDGGPPPTAHASSEQAAGPSGMERAQNTPRPPRQSVGRPRVSARQYRTNAHLAPSRDAIGVLFGLVGPLALVLVWVAATIAAARYRSLDPARVGPDAVEWMRPTIAGSVAFVFRFTVAPALVCFSVALCALWLRQPGPYRGLTRDQYMAAMHLTNMRYCERHGIPLSDAPPIPEYPGLRTDVPRHGGARKHGALVLGMAAVSLVVSAFSIATPVAAAPEWRLTRTGFWTPAAEALWSQTRRISIDHSVSTHTRSYGFGAVRQGQTRVDFRTVAVIQRNGSARTLMWSNDRNDHGLLSDPLRWPQMRFWALALERFAPHVELTYEGDGSTDHEPDKRVVVRAPTRRAELRRQP